MGLHVVPLPTLGICLIGFFVDHCNGQRLAVFWEPDEELLESQFIRI